MKVTRFLAVLGILLIGSQLFLWVHFPTRYNDIIAAAAEKHNIAPSLIHAIIYAESGYDKNAVSRVGAVGLMQLMPATAVFAAELLDLQFDESMLKDPEYNIKLGVFYLSRLLRRFDLHNAVAAYNAGEGNVARWIAEGREEIPFRETRNYVRRVFRVQRVYQFLGVK